MARWNREPLRWEACGRSGAGFGLFLTRTCAASERNRRVRTRTHGGVGPVAGSSSQSRGPDSPSLLTPETDALYPGPQRTMSAVEWAKKQVVAQIERERNEWKHHAWRESDMREKLQEQIMTLVTTDHESKEALIQRVRGILSENVKAHAPPPASARVDHGVGVKIRINHRNRAAGRGCHVAACSTSFFAAVRQKTREANPR